VTDRKTQDELRAARILAAAALVATPGPYITNPRPARDPYATSGVPKSTGKANPERKAERKRQRKARRRGR
jgi:hypothetical protein